MVAPAVDVRVTGPVRPGRLSCKPATPLLAKRGAEDVEGLAAAAEVRAHLAHRAVLDEVPTEHLILDLQFKSAPFSEFANIRLGLILHPVVIEDPEPAKARLQAVTASRGFLSLERSRP